MIKDNPEKQARGLHHQGRTPPAVMTHRERFSAWLDYQPADRMPVYTFGYWDETLARWHQEGLPPGQPVAAAVGLDTDWEDGMWQIHGLATPWPHSEEPEQILEETPEWRLVRSSLGGVHRLPKLGSSIPQHVTPALQPTRESWNRFRGFLDAAAARPKPAGWEAKAKSLNQRDRVATFMAGSLYGWPRDWMGVEGISYLMYDDPVLLEEMLDYLTNHFITLYCPMLERVQFDFAYIFEDCCGKSGPLFSPAIYRRHFDKYYRRLLEFYRSMGVPHMLIDSDGWVDDLVPCWVESGFDILFPIEVGTWGGDPRVFRKRFGRDLRLMGGVDKHVMVKGEPAIRAHLETLRPLAMEGGFLPLPDHRIPPDCSLEQFRTYVNVYKSVFGSNHPAA